MWQGASSQTHVSAAILVSPREVPGQMVLHHGGQAPEGVLLLAHHHQEKSSQEVHPLIPASTRNATSKRSVRGSTQQQRERKHIRTSSKSPLDPPPKTPKPLALGVHVTYVPPPPLALGVHVTPVPPTPLELSPANPATRQSPPSRCSFIIHPHSAQRLASSAIPGRRLSEEASAGGKGLTGGAGSIEEGQKPRGGRRGEERKEPLFWDLTWQ